MADASACLAALEAIARRLSEVDPATRAKHAIDRSVAVHVTDLDATWGGRLQEGLLVDLCADPTDPAQIRLVATSDDVIALAASQLNIAAAWAAGRLRIEASPLDLLRLGALL